MTVRMVILLQRLEKETQGVIRKYVRTENGQSSCLMLKNTDGGNYDKRTQLLQ